MGCDSAPSIVTLLLHVFTSFLRESLDYRLMRVEGGRNSFLPTRCCFFRSYQLIDRFIAGQKTSRGSSSFDKLQDGFRTNRTCITGILIWCYSELSLSAIITDSVVLWKIQIFDWLIPETK